MSKDHNIKKEVKSKLKPLVFPKYSSNSTRPLLVFPKPPDYLIKKKVVKKPKFKIHLASLFKKSGKPIIKPKRIVVKKPKQLKVSVLKKQKQVSPLKSLFSKFKQKKKVLPKPMPPLKQLKVEPPKPVVFPKPTPIKVSSLELDQELAPIVLKPVSERMLVEEGKKLAKLSEKYKPEVKHIKVEKPKKERVYISRNERELLAQEEILKRKLDSLY